jgi:hypothetical protein
MIAQNENPLSSAIERTKTKHLKTEYGRIRIAYRGDKWHYEGLTVLTLFLELRDQNLAPHPLCSKGPIEVPHCAINPFLRLHFGGLRVQIRLPCISFGGTG